MALKELEQSGERELGTSLSVKVDQRRPSLPSPVGTPLHPYIPTSLQRHAAKPLLTTLGRHPRVPTNSPYVSAPIDPKRKAPFAELVGLACAQPR